LVHFRPWPIKKFHLFSSQNWKIRPTNRPPNNPDKQRRRSIVSKTATKSKAYKFDGWSFVSQHDFCFQTISFQQYSIFAVSLSLLYLFSFRFSSLFIPLRQSLSFWVYFGELRPICPKTRLYLFALLTFSFNFVAGVVHNMFPTLSPSLSLSLSLFCPFLVCTSIFSFPFLVSFRP
jgi:hypothetical protein